MLKTSNLIFKSEKFMDVVGVECRRVLKQAGQQEICG